MTDLVGKHIDKYRVEEMLGEGGMGAVYRAFDPKLSRTVALKVMHRHLAKQAQFQQRFMQEAKVAADLGDHPSIATIFEFDSRNGLLYMVMEFVPGGTLYDHTTKAQRHNQVFELKETLFILAQVADALDYAHRKRVVHRDIKPSNILLKHLDKVESDTAVALRAVVTDFGLAKLLEGGVQTATGAFMGTYAYMSPEQCLGRELDGRSDIYSLGIMLYQLSTGRLPFDIKTPQDALLQHPNAVPPSPRLVWQGLPAAVEEIIHRAIEKQPKDRYDTAAALAGDLRQVAAALSQKDVTEYAPPGSVLSLLTQIASGEPSKVPSRFGSDIEVLSGGDVLVIGLRGGSPIAHDLSVPATTVGRGEDNDIFLDDVKASRHHIRIEFDGENYSLTDLNSTNGTYLGETELLPGIVEVWPVDKPVRIGDTWLRIVRAQHAGQVSIFRSDGSQVDPNVTHASAGPGNIVVFIEPAALSVEPGARCEASLSALNRGSVVDHFHLSVTGIPTRWVTFSEPVIRLLPKAQGDVSLTIQPPRASDGRAGRYAFTVRVDSEAHEGQYVELKGTLTVGAFSEFTSELHPQRIRAGGTISVSAQNLGNVPQTVLVELRDRADEIVFDPPQARVKVPIGESSAATFRATPRRRRYFGNVESHVYTARVSSPDGQTQMHGGEVVSKALLPIWILQLMVLPCLALAVVGAFVYNGIQSRNERQRQTLEATRAVGTQVSIQAGTATAVTSAGAAQAETATAEFLVGANQATVEAGTATAIWFDEDDDRDGLSNRQELERNTLTNVRDTDEDGLSDGVEVNQWNTDPLDDDSDDDGLKDGVEVSQGINPLSDDTDGDGTPDAQDPDPGSAPTPTPNETATALALATQTAVVQAAAEATANAAASATARAAATQTAVAQAAADATASAANTATAVAEAAASATAQAQAMAQFLGNWVNVDSNTGGMTRLVIDKIDDDTVGFHGFGKCTPTDCDWDAMVGDEEKMPSSVPLTPPQLVGTYDFGFVVKRISAERSGDELLVEIFDDFSDADGRSDRTSNYVMRRQLIIIPILPTLAPPVIVRPTP